MKIGVAQVPVSKVAFALILWLSAFAFPVSIRPIVLSTKIRQPARISSTKKDLYGFRCLAVAETKIGRRTMLLHAYINPQGCSVLQRGSPVTLRLLKAGPLYWVQFEDDFGYWRTQWALDIVFFVVISSVFAFLIYRITRPVVRPSKPADFGAILRDL